MLLVYSVIMQIVFCGVHLHFMPLYGFLNIFCNTSIYLLLFLVKISSLKRDAGSSERRISNLRCEVPRIERSKGRHDGSL